MKSNTTNFPCRMAAREKAGRWHSMKRSVFGAGVLAALCAMPTTPALASFSNVACGDYYGNASVSGYTDISGNTFNNNASLSVTLNNLSNANGDNNVAAAVLEYEPNVGYGVGAVSIYNSGTMQGITGDSGSWAAGFWSDQIYGNSTIAELIVDNYGTMNGQANNSTGDAFGFHNYNLYGGLNLTNESGATCSATAKGNAGGIDALCYYGAINFVNNGTATGASSGVNVGCVTPIGLNLYTFDSTNRAPIYCENNGYISATATGGQTNSPFGATVWAQGGSMTLINRGTFEGTTWGGGGGLNQAVGVYCGGNVGDDWVVNTGQMIAEGGPGWALGIENDGSNNGNSPYIATINVLNSGVISNGVTSGQASDGIYGGVGIVLWVSSGPTYLTNTSTGIIYGGSMGIWGGVYAGPITIYNSGVIYGGGGEAFHLGDGNDTVYLTGSPTVTGVMNGGNGNNSLIFNLTGTLQTVNGNAANSGNNLSSYGLGTSGSIVVSGKTYSWQNFNVSGTTGGPSTGTYYYMQNRTSGLVIDNRGSTSVGAQMGQWTKVNSSNLKWQLVASDSGYYYIQNQTSGLYLDGGGYTTNGSPVKQWSYASSYNLQWLPVASDSGNYYIQNRATGMYLDGGGATANGADLKQWSYASSYNLQWSFQ